MNNPLINEYRGRFGKGRTMSDLVTWVQVLPAMPDTIARALRMVDDIRTTPDELAAVFMHDPALASPILRSANSVCMGHHRAVTTLAEAVVVVGMGKIKTTLLASAFLWWNGVGPVQRLVWEKSLGAAAAAGVLCEQLNKPYRDELSLTGLLHNLGQIIFLSNKEVGRIYPDVLKQIHDCNEDYVTAEREVIGFSHPLVGALVAQKWEFPLSTCRAILHYAEPFQTIAGVEDEKLGMLKLAAGLSLSLGYGRPKGYSINQAELHDLAVLVGFDPATLGRDLKLTMAEIEARFLSEVSAYN